MAIFNSYVSSPEGKLWLPSSQPFAARRIQSLFKQLTEDNIVANTVKELSSLCLGLDNFDPGKVSWGGLGSKNGLIVEVLDWICDDISRFSNGS